MGIENPLSNNQAKVERGEDVFNAEKEQTRFERYLKISEKAILQDRPTIANVFLADLEEAVEKGVSKGVNFSNIHDFEARITKLRMEAGKIAVLSCFAKAKLALETRDSDPSLLASWYFATEEKLRECKDIISPSDVQLLEEEINNFRTSFLDGVIANPNDDYNTQKEKELNEREKENVEIYEANLEIIEESILRGDLDSARLDFDSLNKFILEGIAGSKFLSSDLQTRIDEVREKLEPANT